ncbi:MAG: biotin--[acetyl-CoA-carboxylase] ligase [Candidatus Cloacimonadaceae bacterium]|nr:biotin--[acetyl-CoA-carboxylase] ligase [Candidatus Cloacimonadaceae bacterium]
MQAELIYAAPDSTMAEYERLRKIANEATAIDVQAKIQSGGIGRNGHSWHSPLGGLWLTADLIHPMAQASFALYVGSCLHRLLISLFGLKDLSIKWTNDIYHRDSKLAGILCKYSSSQNRYVFGIGINLNNLPDPLLNEYRGTSLKAILGFDISIQTFKRLLLESIRAHAGELNQPSLYLDYCDEHLYGKGRACRIDTGAQIQGGSIEGIDELGNLILKDAPGNRQIISHGSILGID